MKGTIKIKINSKNNRIVVRGRVANAELSGQAAIIDSLMRTFDMTGDLRKVVCDSLVYIDEKRSHEKEEKSE